MTTCDTHTGIVEKWVWGMMWKTSVSRRHCEAEVSLRLSSA